MCPQDLRPGVIASLFPSLEKPERVWNKFVFLVFRYMALHCSLSSLSINNNYFLEPFQSIPIFRFDLLFNVKCLWSESEVYI